MGKPNRQHMQNAGLSFFGSIVAGQCHELANVLNIINELAGLQTDLLESSEHGHPKETDKMKQVTDRIRNQVVRGDTMVRSLNRFAHSVDFPVTVFDLKEALERITHLAQRPARLAKTVLDREFPEESISLETSLFGLTQAVFHCIEIALAASTERRRIAVSYQRDNHGAVVEIRSADPMIPQRNTTEAEGFLTLLMEQLGGEQQAAPSRGDLHRFLLFFPAATPHRDTAAPGDKGE